VCHSCRATLREQRKPPPVEPRECHCGAVIENPHARYCSGSCRRKAYCQTAGYKARNRARLAEGYAPRSAVYFVDCQFCGRLATVRSAAATRCRRPECRLAFNAKRMRENGWASVSSDRRRKRLKSAVESVRRWDVFERDGWICGICASPVDREVKAPDMMSPFSALPRWWGVCVPGGRHVCFCTRSEGFCKRLAVSCGLRWPRSISFGPMNSVSSRMRVARRI
jgi:hypothetical protein